MSSPSQYSTYQYDTHFQSMLISFSRQIHRAKEIKAHFLQKQAQETKDKRALAEKRANGVIVSLGLVNADEGGGEEK